MLLAMLSGTYTSNSGSAEAASGAAAGVFLIVMMLFYAAFFAVAIIQIIGMWKVFEKAGQQGWLAIIPFLNYYVLIRIVGRESWWLILYLVPCVNFVVAIIIALDLARVFGKSEGYGVGLAFLPFVFYPMLGFGDARYMGPQRGRVIA